jgi:hypothetical protein
VKKYWRFLALLLIFLAGENRCGYVHDHTGHIADEPSRKPTEESRTIPQIVLIYHDDICTGTIVANNYVLTAAHCGKAGTKFKIYHHDGPKLGATEERYVPDGEDPDLALLKFPDGTFTLDPLPLGFEAAQNDVVDVVGFGCNDVIEKTGQTIKRLGKNRILNVFAFITLYTPLVNNGKLIVGSDNVAGICTGDSGAPLLREGKVIGVASISEVKDDRVYSWYVNLNHETARGFLRNHLNNIP